MKPSELLDRPERWTQFNEARNAHGVPRNYFDIDTCQWCVFGALCYCSGSPNPVDGHEKLTKHLDVISLAQWNDAPGRTWEEVHAALVACGL
jgi:hypothetical protein